MPPRRDKEIAEQAPGDAGDRDQKHRISGLDARNHVVGRQRKHAAQAETTGDEQHQGWSQHRVSANLSLNPSAKCSAYAYATKGISDGSLSAFGSVGYLFAPTWRLSALGTYQKFGAYSYPDAEFVLAKEIGKQEMNLIWSSSLRRFRVEFSALRF